MGPAGVGRSPLQAEPPARLSGDVHISVDGAIDRENWVTVTFARWKKESVGERKEARGCLENWGIGKGVEAAIEIPKAC